MQHVAVLLFITKRRQKESLTYDHIWIVSDAKIKIHIKILDIKIV